MICTWDGFLLDSDAAANGLAENCMWTNDIIYNFQLNSVPSITYFIYNLYVLNINIRNSINRFFFVYELICLDISLNKRKLEVDFHVNYSIFLLNP
jgi:hypothetical protein